MSKKIADFPFAPVQFDRHGQPYDVNETKAFVQMIKDEGLTDLVVISHGWNNNISEATELYTGLLKNMPTLVDQGVASNVEWDKVGVYWPSKKWTAEELQPGGGASVSGGLRWMPCWRRNESYGRPYEIGRSKSPDTRGLYSL